MHLSGFFKIEHVEIDEQGEAELPGHLMTFLYFLPEATMKEPSHPKQTYILWISITFPLK